MEQQGRMICITGTSGEEPFAREIRFWRHYLALDVDYRKILDELAMPPEVVESSQGIRVLAQDWWDTAVSFVISQNSNITRIQRTMDALMDASCGMVPRPEKLRALLADDAFAEGLRLGYRRPYLEALAELAAEGWEPMRVRHRNVTLEQSMEELEELPGVGPKVASCICLYGLGYLEAVPHDTWIKRAEREYQIAWHPRWGGIQQQYVFAWIRGQGR
jgi:N-glycosylase/DNA lyase